MEISARQILKMREDLYAILARHSGKAPAQIHADSDRDYWLWADEGKGYGLIDEVLDRA